MGHRQGLRKQQVSINNPKHPTRVQSSLAHQWNLDGPQARLASAEEAAGFNKQPEAPNTCPKQPGTPVEPRWATGKACKCRPKKNPTSIQRSLATPVKVHWTTRRRLLGSTRYNKSPNWHWKFTWPPSGGKQKIAPAPQQKHCYRPGKLKEGAGELSTSETQRHPQSRKKTKATTARGKEPAQGKRRHREMNPEPCAFKDNAFSITPKRSVNQAAREGILLVPLLWGCRPELSRLARSSNPKGPSWPCHTWSHRQGHKVLGSTQPPGPNRSPNCHSGSSQKSMQG